MSSAGRVFLIHVSDFSASNKSNMYATSVKAQNFVKNFNLVIAKFWEILDITFFVWARRYVSPLIFSNK